MVIFTQKNSLLTKHKILVKFWHFGQPKIFMKKFREMTWNWWCLTLINFLCWQNTKSWSSFDILGSQKFSCKKILWNDMEVMVIDTHKFSLLTKLKILVKFWHFGQLRKSIRKKFVKWIGYARPSNPKARRLSAFGHLCMFWLIFRRLFDCEIKILFRCC